MTLQTIYPIAAADVQNVWLPIQTHNLVPRYGMAWHLHLCPCCFFVTGIPVCLSSVSQSHRATSHVVDCASICVNVPTRVILNLHSICPSACHPYCVSPVLELTNPPTTRHHHRCQTVDQPAGWPTTTGRSGGTNSSSLLSIFGCYSDHIATP